MSGDLWTWVYDTFKRNALRLPTPSFLSSWNVNQPPPPSSFAWFLVERPRPLVAVSATEGSLIYRILVPRFFFRPITVCSRCLAALGSLLPSCSTPVQYFFRVLFVFEREEGVERRARTSFGSTYPSFYAFRFLPRGYERRVGQSFGELNLTSG